MSRLLNIIDKLDPDAKRQILTLRTNQRRDYMLSVSNLVGLNFWSEHDDLMLDDIDNKLAMIVERSINTPSLEKLAANLAEPEAAIPSFLNKPPVFNGEAPEASTPN